MACDICGSKWDALTEVKELYRTEEIRHVCPACQDAIDRQLRRLRAMWYERMLPNLVKCFMHGRKVVAPAPVGRPWLLRIGCVLAVAEAALLIAILAGVLSP